jgi:hypothetical protein
MQAAPPSFRQLRCVVKVGEFWESSVDVGPTMRDRSANAGSFPYWKLHSKAWRRPHVSLVLGLLEVPSC